MSIARTGAGGVDPAGRPGTAPGDHGGPGVSTPDATGAAAPDAVAAVAPDVHESPEFLALRRTFRRTIFPATAAFLAWYFAYVLLTTYAPDFMSTRVGGNITVGLLFGLGQFVTTFAITMGYRRWADRELDPTAAVLRDRVETGVAR